jgi:hypothetical protein
MWFLSCCLGSFVFCIYHINEKSWETIDFRIAKGVSVSEKQRGLKTAIV